MLFHILISYNFLPFVKCLFQTLANSWIVCHFLIDLFLNYIFGYELLEKIFSQSMACIFTLSVVSFDERNFFILIYSNFSFFYYMIVAFMSILFIYLFIYFWPCRATCGILVPQPGIEPVPHAVEAQSPNFWTAREFPFHALYKKNLLSLKYKEICLFYLVKYFLFVFRI